MMMMMIPYAGGGDEDNDGGDVLRESHILWKHAVECATEMLLLPLLLATICKCYSSGLPSRDHVLHSSGVLLHGSSFCMRCWLCCYCITRGLSTLRYGRLCFFEDSE